MGRVPCFCGGLDIWSWQPGTAGGKGDNIVVVATTLKLKKLSGTGEDQTSGLHHGQDVREETSKKPALSLSNISFHRRQKKIKIKGYVPPVSQKCSREPGSCWAGCCSEDRTPSMGFCWDLESIHSVSRKPMAYVSLCCGWVAIPPHLLEALYHSLSFNCPFSSYPRDFWGLILWSSIRLP